jgi:hypothetical protein
MRVVLAMALFGCAVLPLWADVTEEWFNNLINVTVVAARADASGNSYLTATSTNLGNNDILTLKYSATGGLVWSNRFAGPSNADDRASQLILDGQGNSYVFGQSTGTNRHVGYGYLLQDMVVLKYSSTGQSQWIARVSSPHNIDLFPGRMALDTAGNVYLTAIERDARGYPVAYTNGSYPQFYTVKLGPTGNQLWRTNYPSQAPPSLKIYSTPVVTVRPSGGVLVACEDGVLRFQFDGTRSTNLALPQVQGGPIIPTAMLFDKATNLFTAGAAYSPNTAVICKYNQDTTIQWTNTEFALGSDTSPGAPSTLLLDGYGNCYAGGYTASTNAVFAFAFLLKSSGNGHRAWDSWRQMDANGHFAVPQFALGLMGHVYMAYPGLPDPYLFSGTSQIALVKHWPEDGRVQELRHNSAGTTLAFPNAIGMDATNDVFVAGTEVFSGAASGVLIKFKDPFVQPKFQNLSVGSGGQVQAQFVGVSNNTYFIQASLDLKNWATVSNYFAVQNTNALVLDLRSNATNRYFRAVTK